MKFSININQAVLSSTKLDLVDCAILDWIYHYCNSRNEKIEAKRLRGHTWISYSELIQDMPLIRIKSKSAITKRIGNIRNAGYIVTFIDNEKLYINTTKKIDELLFNTVRNGEQSAETVRLKEQNRSFKRTDTVRLNERTNILVTSNTNTKESVAEATTPKEKAQRFFDGITKLMKKESCPEMVAILQGIADRYNIPKAVLWNEVRDFGAYWTEKNGTGMKELWQMHKTFEVDRRLQTWLRRSKFNPKSDFINKPKGKTVSV